MTRTQAQHRNRWIWRATGQLGLLHNVPPDILSRVSYTQAELDEVVYALAKAMDECLYTYSTCSHCKISLTGRNHQARNTKFVHRCDVCGTTERLLGSVMCARISRMKIPLHKARSKMRLISPELFI